MAISDGIKRRREEFTKKTTLPHSKPEQWHTQYYAEYLEILLAEKQQEIERLNGDIRKPEQEEPIIKRSGETWVARYEGVDYLWIGDQIDASPTFPHDLVGNKGGMWWKPFSEIEINDETAQSCPMVVEANGKIKMLIAVFGTSHKYKVTAIDPCDNHSDAWDDCRLATVDDLEDQYEYRY